MAVVEELKPAAVVLDDPRVPPEPEPKVLAVETAPADELERPPLGLVWLPPEELLPEL